MTNSIEAFLASQLAKPITHHVVTTYADGTVREFGCRSKAAAENHAVLDRRNIGRTLKVRGEPGKTVQIVNVEVVAL